MIALLLSDQGWKRTLGLFLSGTRWQAFDGKDRHLRTDLSLGSNKMPAGGLFPSARSPPMPSLQSTPGCAVISLCGRDLGTCVAASNMRNVNGCTVANLSLNPESDAREVTNKDPGCTHPLARSNEPTPPTSCKIAVRGKDPLQVSAVFQTYFGPRMLV